MMDNAPFLPLFALVSAQVLIETGFILTRFCGEVRIKGHNPVKIACVIYSHSAWAGNASLQRERWRRLASGDNRVNGGFERSAAPGSAGWDDIRSLPYNLLPDSSDKK